LALPSLQEQTKPMGTVDYVVVFLYAIAMVWLALVASRRSKGTDAYFAAGHALPWWMAAISHHVSGYSAVVFVGFAGKAASAGLSMWMLFSVPCFIAMMIGAKLWAPRWSRLKVLTPVQYLEERYGVSVRIAVALSGIGVKFIDLGIKLYAIAIVVQVSTGWERTPIIIVGGVVTCLYVLIGGLWATVLTDLVQFAVQFFLSIIVVTAVLAAVGGWGSMWDQLPEANSQLFNPDAGLPIEFWFVYLIVVIFSYNGGTWGLAQRFIAVGDARDTQKAALLSGALFLVYPLVIFVPAWSAPLLMPEFFDPITAAPIAGFDPDQTYVLVAKQILQSMAPGLIGLLVCSMFAATMSMIDSDINSLAAVFTKDVWERGHKQPLTDAQLTTVGRLATLAFGTAVLGAALAVDGSAGIGKVFSKTVQLFAAILPPVAIPLMFGMLFKRATVRGALGALVGGFAAFAILKSIYPDSFAIYTGGEMIVASIIFFGDGFLSRRTPEKEAEVEALFERIEGRPS
ncbi:MAG: sodium/solute symporter, partial [Candidatus Latescibacteria bacterium]|nr:sodium/solute symporter [Candidatus Latescibacterota bacterium]